jgi:hypothetical protein
VDEKAKERLNRLTESKKVTPIDLEHLSKQFQSEKKAQTTTNTAKHSSPNELELEEDTTEKLLLNNANLNLSSISSNISNTSSLNTSNSLNSSSYSSFKSNKSIDMVKNTIITESNQAWVIIKKNFISIGISLLKIF